MDYLIKNETWEKIYNFFKTQKKIHKYDETALRFFCEAVVFIVKSGCQWRLLPREYGHWRGVHKRFKHWQIKGIWEKTMQFFIMDPDLEYLIIDSTVIRAHACSAGYKKNSGETEALGRSVGGFTTKIHAVVDALGNPLRFILTAGQRHDSTQAENLIDGIKFEGVLADKAYDNDELIKKIHDNNGIVVVPPKSNRLITRKYDKHIYKERNLVECFFSKIKHYRRIFSRFDKAASTYLAFLHLVSILIWLR